jgi:hypothetical protein
MLEGQDPGEFLIRDYSNCAAGLKAGSSCSVYINTYPSSLGIKNATFVVSAAIGTTWSNLVENGVAPSLTANVSQLDFGTIAACNASSAPQTITVTNVGTGPSPALGWPIWGSYQHDWIVDPSSSCVTSNIAAGASCTIAITFTDSGGCVAPGVHHAEIEPFPNLFVSLTGTRVCDYNYSYGTAFIDFSLGGACVIGTSGFQPSCSYSQDSASASISCPGFSAQTGTFATDCSTFTMGGRTFTKVP